MLIFLLLILEAEMSRIKVVPYLVSDMGLFFFDGISLLSSHVEEGKTSSSILIVSFSLKKCFEAESHFVAQVVFQIIIFLPQSPKLLGLQACKTMLG